MSEREPRLPDERSGQATSLRGTAGAAPISRGGSAPSGVGWWVALVVVALAGLSFWIHVARALGWRRAVRSAVANEARWWLIYAPPRTAREPLLLGMARVDGVLPVGRHAPCRVHHLHRQDLVVRAEHRNFPIEHTRPSSDLVSEPRTTMLRPSRSSASTRPRSFAVADRARASTTSITPRSGVDGFSHRRLLEPIGHVPPAEFEATYWKKERSREYAGLNEAKPPVNPGRFNHWLLSLCAARCSGAGSTAEREGRRNQRSLPEPASS